MCKAVVEVRKPIAIEANKPPSLPYGIDVRIGFEKFDLSGNSLDMRNIVASVIARKSPYDSLLSSFRVATMPPLIRLSTFIRESDLVFNISTKLSDDLSSITNNSRNILNYWLRMLSTADFKYFLFNTRIRTKNFSILSQGSNRTNSPAMHDRLFAPPNQVWRKASK